ncbi:MAG: DUF5119 domain-containing protein [Rikenellaceae bacterium]
MRRLLILLIFCFVYCTRRQLSDTECTYDDAESALIDVSVDWSLSGFDTDQQSKGDEDYIHRVTFRFFPLDGSTPFDRYLEDDVESGTIYVPIGSYSVVIFNESIYDTYWQNTITFEDVDSYDLFAAKIADQSADLYFYTPADDEALSVEALQLASCSVAHFEVSESMCSAATSDWSDEDLEMAQRLNPVSPRRLTCPTTIEVDTEYLSSAASVHVSLTGLAQRVFMACGDTDTLTTTHVHELTERTWRDDSTQHGVISESRLTFSTPNTTSSTHTLTLDVYLIDGTHHQPEEEMVYDVSDQIVGSITRYADDDLAASVSLTLPEVSGDIEVNDWGDDNEITIQ